MAHDLVKFEGQLPGWLLRGMEQRAGMHGLTRDEYMAEAMSALFEHREPVFERKEKDRVDSDN